MVTMYLILYIAVLLPATVLVSSRPNDLAAIAKAMREEDALNHAFRLRDEAKNTDDKIDKKASKMDEEANEMDEEVNEMDQEAKEMDEEVNKMDKEAKEMVEEVNKMDEEANEMDKDEKFARQMAQNGTKGQTRYGGRDRYLNFGRK